MDCSIKKIKTGDKGQRFEVRFLDESESNEHIFGWSDTIEGAKVMADAINLHPSFHSPIIIDRSINKKYE